MRPTPLFRGTGTAIVTPFTADGRLDYDAFRRLIEFQIRGGVEAIVVLGTTGENPTIEDDERDRLVETAIEATAGRARVIVGTGTNSTTRSVAYARRASAYGADGQLVVAPYYNKPTQEGFAAHVRAIAEATDLPIILYNVPGRTGLNVAADTTLAIANEIDSVAGVKEASGNLAQISDILSGRPLNFAVYSGDDEMALPIAALGGDGCISVISNALPAAFSRLVRLALTGHVEAARSAHFELLNAMRACFAETNPIPIKHALAEMGLITPTVRLPLLPATHRASLIIRDAFAAPIAEATRSQPVAA